MCATAAINAVVEDTFITLSGNSEALNKSAGDMSSASAMSKNASIEKLFAASGASIMLKSEQA